MADRSASVDAMLASVRNNKPQSKSMRERLSDLFRGTDYVRIRNSLDVDFVYVFTDPREEVVTQPDKATRRVEFGEPKARQLAPGEEKVILGWEAYIALNHMWKQYAQSRNQEMGITMTSSIESEQFLKRSFLGVFDPNNIDFGDMKNLGFDPAQPGEDRQVEAPAPVGEPQVPQPEAEQPAPVAPAADDLGFANEQPDPVQPPVVQPMHNQPPADQ